MRNRNDFCGILSTNRFATYAPSNEIGTQSIRVISNDLSSIILLRTYWVNRELSINKPIAPDVKRNTDFSRLNAERNVLLIAPPTPNIPAKNPERSPPVNAVWFDDLMFHNICDYFRERGIKTENYHSGNITEAFGVASRWTDHDALNDCRDLVDGLRLTHISKH